MNIDAYRIFFAMNRILADDDDQRLDIVYPDEQYHRVDSSLIAIY